MTKSVKSLSVLFLLEEVSACEMLRKMMPRHFPSLSCRYRTFSGKPDLMARMEKTIKNHTDKDCHFVIVCDQDLDDCIELKNRIAGSCQKTGKKALCHIRIACHELESWYLAQLDVVSRHFGVPEVIRLQNTKYRYPDNTTKPSEDLRRITKGNYQKVKGSRIMGDCLDPNVDRSTSFKNFIAVLKKLV
jgi:hypothetical protein